MAGLATHKGEGEEIMAQLQQHHKELINGEGKCSVPMWCYGLPAGFCDRDAFWYQLPGRVFRDRFGERFREDGKYAGYVPALACPNHGGPEGA